PSCPVPVRTSDACSRPELASSQRAGLAVCPECSSTPGRGYYIRRRRGWRTGRTGGALNITAHAKKAEAIGCRQSVAAVPDPIASVVGQCEKESSLRRD